MEYVRSSRILGPFSVGVGLVAAACSLARLDGFSTGGEPVDDAGASGPDRGVQVLLDPPAQDAATADGAAASPFCATVSGADAGFFRCFDYDAPGATLNGPDGYPSTTFAIERDDGSSRPNALVVRMPSLAAGILGGGGDLIDVLPFGRLVRTLEFAFDLRADLSGSEASTFTVMSATWGFFLMIGPTYGRILEQTTVNGGHPTFSLDASKWHHYAGTVSLDRNVFSMMVDGQLTFADEPLKLVPGPSSLRVEVGIHYASGPVGPTVAHFDDVVIRARF